MANNNHNKMANSVISKKKNFFSLCCLFIVACGITNIFSAFLYLWWCMLQVVKNLMYLWHFGKWFNKLRKKTLRKLNQNNQRKMHGNNGKIQASSTCNMPLKMFHKDIVYDEGNYYFSKRLYNIGVYFYWTLFATQRKKN